MPDPRFPWILRVLTAALAASLVVACSEAPEPSAAAEATPEPAPAEPVVTEPEKVSRFGEYSGYSEEKFDSWVNTSRYVEMRDGVKLAVDITFPAMGGEKVEGQFPVVWTHSRYHRNPGALAQYFAGEGEEVPEVNSQVDANPGLQMLVKHGYIVAAVQVRGGGASYGRYCLLYTSDAADD